jgi:hypothetical protein
MHNSCIHISYIYIFSIQRCVIGYSYVLYDILQEVEKDVYSSVRYVTGRKKRRRWLRHTGLSCHAFE